MNMEASQPQGEAEDDQQNDALSTVYGPALPFTDDDLEACVKVVMAVGDSPNLLAATWLRGLRKALTPLVDTMAEKRYDSTSAKRKREDVSFKMLRNDMKDRMRQLDAKATSQCRLRADRVAKMQRIQAEECAQLVTIPRIPDGPADDVHRTRSPLQIENEGDAGPRRLFQSRDCYVCGFQFQELHHFYHALCTKCGDFNYAKRRQTANMTGKVALVTGARIKVGYYVTLKLLEAGATVLATTRFPRDAIERFTKEPRFNVYKDRLHFFGVDLRDIVHLHCFLDYIATAFPRIDIIVHNACQTIRRPPQFYRHLIEKEIVDSSSHTSTLLTHHDRLETQRVQPEQRPQIGSHNKSDAVEHPARPTTIISSALKSQIPLLHSDTTEDAASFPHNALDIHGQQIDLRPKNSWLLKLGEVETPELAEVFTINAMAPFIINNRLLPTLERECHGSLDHPDPRYIINVSAMEGKFYRTKKATHPHTNMAKAALNMMTRTCAGELKTRGIVMNSVDTGWINDENPTHVAVAAAEAHGFQTPLDEIDAAARVLDPVFTSETTLFGCFLKDYQPTEW